MGFAARVGMAFHHTVQWLVEDASGLTSPDAIATAARARFEDELRQQEAEAAARPRERTLPHDQSRVERAREAIIDEAIRLARTRVAPSPTPGSLSPVDDFPRDDDVPGGKRRANASEDEEVEIPVVSADGRFRGRVDRAEHLPQGTRLVDYKSAVRDDLPERYERQLQLYAYMWHETRGAWPVEASVVYPLTGSTYPVAVDPETCQRIADDAGNIVQRIQTERAPGDLATPGDICTACEFRPWCRPFWRWQSGEATYTVALDRARVGFEGRVTAIEVVDQHWKVLVQWRDATVRLVAPLERFPQLRRVQVGARLRVMDTRLHDLRRQPQVTIGELSELFIMRETKSDGV
jgi:CRISPR/Cas system-associated exonuclease Cas4 (RecB family)